MIFRNKWFAITWLALALIISQGGSTSIVLGNTTDRIIETRDLSEISQIRKMLRTACAQIKKADAKPEDAGRLLSDAETETGQALKKWTAFSKGFVAVTPTGYANHPDWHKAAEEIEKSILQMAQSAKDQDAKTALARCGQTCQKFVEMNKMAGIELTTDILFQFRKAAKSLLATIREKNSNEITPAVQTLLALKRRSMGHSVDGTGLSVPKSDALVRFSTAVDAFAASVEESKRVDLDVRYQEMMALMETAYDQYL
jgi:hypothetical protein